MKKDGADGWIRQSVSPLSLMCVAHTRRASLEGASLVPLSFPAPLGISAGLKVDGLLSWPPCPLRVIGAAEVNIEEAIGWLSLAVPVGEWLDTDRFWTPDVRCANADSGAWSVSPPLLVFC